MDSADDPRFNEKFCSLALRKGARINLGVSTTWTSAAGLSTNVLASWFSDSYILVTISSLKSPESIDKLFSSLSFLAL